ncbi:MAG TPA: DUF1854 domain-containing protein [Planctomycetaceae bacterium]|nr:DUF1854 domain-containing protein [Planctomycetaceae bacterium]
MTAHAAPPCELHHDAWGRLVLTLPDGTVHADVEPARAFPWTDPDTAVTVLDSDGREILLLSSLAGLSQGSRAALEREFANRDFVPSIVRVVQSSGPWPPCVWQVETDRGAATVTIDSEDDVRRLSADRVLIADSSGLRFLISDVQTLDAASLRHLRRLL